ncbi:hypothetical protein B0H19DRAFT_1059392 [Mycena capillaripes]|nr:hypothetical protein B0H19DRAFT_1059392 [Mycena capillaripes]
MERLGAFTQSFRALADNRILLAHANFMVLFVPAAVNVGINLTPRHPMVVLVTGLASLFAAAALCFVSARMYTTPVLEQTAMVTTAHAALFACSKNGTVYGLIGSFSTPAMVYTWNMYLAAIGAGDRRCWGLTRVTARGLRAVGRGLGAVGEAMDDVERALEEDRPMRRRLQISN